MRYDPRSLPSALAPRPSPLILCVLVILLLSKGLSSLVVSRRLMGTQAGLPGQAARPGSHSSRMLISAARFVSFPPSCVFFMVGYARRPHTLSARHRARAAPPRSARPTLSAILVRSRKSRSLASPRPQGRPNVTRRQHQASSVREDVPHVSSVAPRWGCTTRTGNGKPNTASKSSENLRREIVGK